MPHGLSEADAALVSVSAALAARSEVPLRAALQRAAEVADAPDVEEVILQSYLFLGYPIALEAFRTWREVSGVPPGPPSSDGDWAARGEEVCRAVYGGQYENLRARVQTLHPDMERWMVREGYGKVLGRPGPDLRLRELCIAALLAVLDAPRQLYSHLRGARLVGATDEEIEGALELASAFSGEGARAHTRETWDSVRARRER